MEVYIVPSCAQNRDLHGPDSNSGQSIEGGMTPNPIKRSVNLQQLA